MIKERKAPRCLVGKCPIADIMESPDCHRIERQVAAFLAVECLGETAGYSALMEREVRESGLGDLPAPVILRMRTEFIKHRNALKDQAK